MNIRAQQTTTVRSQNSWYLKTGYIHNFICRCGLVDQYTCSILGHAYHPDHTCSACGNRCFLDAVMFLENKKVTRWSRFCWSIEKIKTDKAWIVRTVASIPLFDYALQKIHIRKVIFATGTLGFDGEYIYKEEEPVVLRKYIYNRGKAEQIAVLMRDALVRGLYDLIREETIERIAWLGREDITRLAPREKLKVYAFFLRHVHLREFDFYRWRHFEDFANHSKKYPTVKQMLDFVLNHHREECIRKIFFGSYRDAIESGGYDPVADYLFSRYIGDVDLLLKLISMDRDIKNTLFDGYDLKHLEMFFVFLLDRYGERGLIKLFSPLSRDGFRGSHLVRDILWVYHNVEQDFIQENFIKVSPDLKSLHRELTRISYLWNAILSEERKK